MLSLVSPKGPPCLDLRGQKNLQLKAL